MADVSIRVPGIVLASLMFEHCNSDSDVEGLICGEIKDKESLIVDDIQNDHIHLEQIIDIQKHIPCHTLNNFYNGVGEVNQDTMRQILSENQETVIGWYRQRRNTEQQMTFREKSVHQNLKKALSNPEFFFLLLTPGEVTSQGGTHRTEYAAFQSHSSGQFHNVPVVINNLGLVEQQDYWKLSVPCSAAGYNRAMQKHKLRFFSNGSLKEVIEVNDMNDSLQSELQKACSEVETSEQLVEKLQADVRALRKQISKKRRLTQTSKAAAKPASKRNVALQEALKAMFPCSPHLQTQTLNLQGIPVLEAHCSSVA